MKRILIHVEGQTEESFVNEVLAEHLGEHGFGSVAPRLLGNARQRSNRGGVKSWESTKAEIVRHLKEDRAAISTTMVDYYALPNNWPGRTAAQTKTSPENAKLVEAAIHADLIAEMGGSFDPNRFVPFIVLHEFEGLLFSDCAAFANAVGDASVEQHLSAIRSQFASPEHINDSPQTAPSKRIAAVMPGYQKTLHGVLAAIEIGLPQIRSKCPHFRCWVNKLEYVGAL